MLLGGVVAAACAGPPAATAPEARAPNAPRQSEEPRRPKVLAIGVQREPPGFNPYVTQGGSTTGGATQVFLIAHDYLMVEADRSAGTWDARLATEQVAVERGTWRLNPDGTMETIWKLRPNITWQDGTPFTSDDLLFSFTVYKDPDIPTSIGAPLALMESATAPDPHTFVVRWSGIYVRADEAPGLIPMPRHLLAEVYRTDKANFANSPFFSTEFIGLGPYRLTRWERDVEMQFARYEDYHRGTPPLATVIVRFLGDVNTEVANILAGALDIVLPTGVDLETALDVKKRWEGTGNQVTTGLSGGVRHLEIQFRPEYAQPRNGLPNRAVRQALYHAIDRETLNEVLNSGLAPVADSWIPPNHQLRPQLEVAIPQFPLDLRRAQQLLAEARWERGSDGTLVHAPSGERFVIEINGSQGLRTDKEEPIIADGWKALGAEVSMQVIPAARGRDREYRSKLSGVNLSGGVGFDDFTTDRLHSKYITSEATRWNGTNRGGYSNPTVDGILERLIVTVPQGERLPLHRELLREQMGDVALMPLYWQVDPVLALRGVKNFDQHTWNFFTWDKE
jgi:peptide/nickel transport system substrate-binding protein